MPADHVHEPSVTSPMTNAGVACTQKTNDDASWLQCQKMGKECTHAIECISFFTGIVDIYYSFACLVLPYPGNTGENKPYQWDLPKNKRMKVTVKTKWANFFNWPKSQSAWVLVCALWTVDLWPWVLVFTPWVLVNKSWALKFFPCLSFY